MRIPIHSAQNMKPTVEALARTSAQRQLSTSRERSTTMMSIFKTNSAVANCVGSWCGRLPSSWLQVSTGLACGGEAINSLKAPAKFFEPLGGCD